MLITARGLNNSRRFHLAPGLVESAQGLDILETAKTMCTPPFYGLGGLQRVAFRGVVSAVF